MGPKRGSNEISATSESSTIAECAGAIGPGDARVCHSADVGSSPSERFPVSGCRQPAAELAPGSDVKGHRCQATSADDLAAQSCSPLGGKI